MEKALRQHLCDRWLMIVCPFKDFTKKNLIISMARTLGLKTIVEGVETEEQWKILRLLRCHMGQGYLFSPPLPAKDAEKLLI